MMIILRERIMLSAVFFFVLLFVAIDIVQPPPTRGRDHFLFYRSKLNAPPIHDIVVTGDSRVLRDVSPLALAGEVGSDYKITNLAIAFVALDHRMFQVVDQQLHRNPDRLRMIMIGVGPRMFLESLADSAEMKRFSHVSWFEAWFSSFNDLLIPTSFSLVWSHVKSALHGGRPYGFFEEERPYGWLPGWRHPIDEAHDANFYINTFTKEKVSQTIIQNVFKQLAVWRDMGIRVVGFRPPISDRIYQIERQLSQFDEQAFVAQWRAHGGDWLDMPMEAFQTYDGSHLNKAAAISFSIALGVRLKQEGLLKLNPRFSSGASLFSRPSTPWELEGLEHFSPAPKNSNDRKG